MYLTSQTSSGADVFTINNSSQLEVVTTGSQYAGNTAIARAEAGDSTSEWFYLSAKAQGGVSELCCGVQANGLLNCDYGALFGYCYHGMLFEGSVKANSSDYDYSEYNCQAVSLKVVAAS